MRLGCAVAPPAMVEKLSAAVWTTTICVPPISADLLCGWIEDGTAMRILEWKRHEVAARQAMAKRLLDGHRVQTHPSSPHVWLHLPARWTAEAFAAEMRSRGVLVNAVDGVLASAISRAAARDSSASGRRARARASSRR